MDLEDAFNYAWKYQRSKRKCMESSLVCRRVMEPYSELIQTGLFVYLNP